MTEALGALGHTDFKQVTLQKDVKVQITPKKEPLNRQSKKAGVNQGRVIITCDGPLEIDYAKNVAVFSNSVKVDKEDVQIYSDTMDVYFLVDKEKKPGSAAVPGQIQVGSIDKIFCRGNVKIVRGENVSYSDEALYTADDKKITLLGKPRLIIYSTEDLNAPSGN
jgi:lipopolysaccharide assembly outer membrane protein LptD (OstA)